MLLGTEKMKNNDIEIIDNFLLELECNRLIDQIVKNEYFPWFYSPVTRKEYGVSNQCEELYDYQFTHVVYHDNAPKSDYYFSIAPFLNYLKIKSLIKAKFNCNPNSSKIVEHGYHIDTIDSSYNSITGIYYLNSNNGYTKFENGQVVESISNRLVLFPSNMLHTGTTCTDQQARYVLNINYF